MARPAAPAFQAAPARATRGRLLVVALAVAVAAALFALDWDLQAVSDGDARARAVDRLLTFLAAFGAPDLSHEALTRGLILSIQTLAIALLGTALATALGWSLGILASRAVWLDGERNRGGGLGRLARRVGVEAARLALDVLRGVPDFAWALLILTVPGPGPVTGVLAIALSTGGILGKIYSELWDTVGSAQLDSLRSTGAGRLATFLYGLQPLTARPMLSYTLMRLECAVRNATVIGVVGGGGLGAELFDELGYGHHEQVVTLLLFLLALSATTDLFGNFLRRQLQDDPNHPRAARAVDLTSARRRRGLALGSVAVAGLASLFWLGPAFARAGGELARIEWGWIGSQLARLGRPDLSAATLLEALHETRVPLALALLGTLGGVSLAALLVWPSSVAFQLEPERFTGERVGAFQRGLRLTRVLCGRGTALVLRSVPEVAWVLILAAFFRLGPLPGVLAMALHSGGVLARVFVETIDNVPYRRLEPATAGGRAGAFLYAALPESRRTWTTHALFQFEVNVRMGLVFGILGVGGLGDRFHTSLSHWSLERASTFLLAMVLLTVLLDRLARTFGPSRRRTG